MRSILDTVSLNHQIHEATGATMFGPDASLWPAWYADAVAVIQTQMNLELSTLHASDK